MLPGQQRTHGATIKERLYVRWWRGKVTFFKQRFDRRNLEAKIKSTALPVFYQGSEGRMSDPLTLELKTSHTVMHWDKRSLMLISRIIK